VAKIFAGTIDLTPKWAAVLPILIQAIENGKPDSRQFATEELQNMATAADMWNDHAKAKEKAPDKRVINTETQWEGVQARDGKASFKDCPYEAFSVEAADWLMGWAGRDITIRSWT